MNYNCNFFSSSLAHKEVHFPHPCVEFIYIIFVSSPILIILFATKFRRKRFVYFTRVPSTITERPSYRFIGPMDRIVIPKPNHLTNIRRFAYACNDYLSLWNRWTKPVIIMTPTAPLLTYCQSERNWCSVFFAVLVAMGTGGL
jgi:hypothetical protein